jgi:hypothetical protein
MATEFDRAYHSQGLFDCVLQNARTMRQSRFGMLVGQPVEHQCGREDLRRRVGDALARNIRCAAVRRLENSVLFTDVCRRHQTKAANQSSRQIRKDAAEHIFGDQNVEIPR